MPQDVTGEAGCRQVVDAVSQLAVLVNSAGVAFKGNIETATLEDWRKTQAVIVEGTFLGCREAIHVLKATGGGSTVNLSSVAGIVGDAQSAACCASKGAVRLLTKSAAPHCGRAGYNTVEFGAPLLRRYGDGSGTHCGVEESRTGPRARR